MAAADDGPFERGGARVVLTDAEFAPVMKAALAMLARPVTVVDIDDPEGPAGGRLGAIRYEDLLAEGDPAFAWPGPRDGATLGEVMLRGNTLMKGYLRNEQIQKFVLRERARTGP
jgi:acyl-CoA synthetase (AMP-forming)/AMP-acid ligase II